MSRERVVQVWYRAVLPNGEVLCLTSIPSEVVRQSRGMRCTFQQYEVVQSAGPWKEWKPDAPH